MAALGDSDSDNRHVCIMYVLQEAPYEKEIVASHVCEAGIVYKETKTALGERGCAAPLAMRGSDR